MGENAPQVQMWHGDSLEVLPASVPDNSVDLILTDPPYHKAKSNLAWDRQWKTDAAFLEWMGCVLAEFQRVLRPNGSLYLFASPRMAARVECKTLEYFNVLNQIVWRKVSANGHEAGWHRQACKETLRGYFPNTERIIFAEHYGADNIAKGEAGYAAKCDELRGFVFEPLRAYLDGERERAGLTVRQVAEAFQKKTGSRTVTGMAGHWFTRVQWTLPTAANYEWLRFLFNVGGVGYLRREYEDLRQQYEDLRQQYEDLRRPFTVSADVPYTDVWTFPTVKTYPGKHECEKPGSLLQHAILASSRPGAVVLDAFAGRFSTGLACLATGRACILIEKDAKHFAAGRERIDKARGESGLFAPPAQPDA